MSRGNGVFYFTQAQVDQLTAASSYPAAGYVGSSGYDTFRGPKFFDSDISLVKRFRFTERQPVTFRAEAYNVFNNVNFANPATAALTITTPTTFGKISTDFGPGGGGASGRVLQGALRYDF